MRRASSSPFPGGAPGFGLLLLRITVGTELGWYGCAYFVRWQDPEPLMILAAALALACAASIVAGYRTGLASLLAAAVNIIVALSSIQPNAVTDATRISSVFGAVIAIALAGLGPGALSVDAFRYGHREIVIPRAPASRPDE
jgi:uncharacterized membrane protein YphA (DoxX/SURF4 family)